MEEFFFLISGMFIFSAIGALVGGCKGEKYLGALLCFFLGPFGLFLLCLSSGNRRACPACREKITVGASLCPHCRTEMSWSGRRPTRKTADVVQET